MEVNKDFKDLIVLFKKYNVDFVIVGGYALALHGAPRYTGDIDFYVKPDLENSKKILRTLNDFGFSSLDLNDNDFKFPDKIVQFGLPPNRIDIMTSLSGVTWEEVQKGKKNGMFGDQKVFYIGINEFKKNKKASGRKKDQADLEALGEVI